MGWNLKIYKSNLLYLKRYVIGLTFLLSNVAVTMGVIKERHTQRKNVWSSEQETNTISGDKLTETGPPYVRFQEF